MPDYEEDEEMTDEETEFALRLGGGSDARPSGNHKEEKEWKSAEHVFAVESFLGSAILSTKVLKSFEEDGKVTIIARYSDSSYGIATFEPSKKIELSEYGFVLPFGRSGMNKVNISRSHAESLLGVVAKDISLANTGSPLQPL